MYYLQEENSQLIIKIIIECISGVYNNILSVRSLEQTKLLCNVCCCCILAPSIPLPQMSGSFVIALFRLSLQLFRLLRSDNLAVALTFNAIQSNLRNFKIAVFLAALSILILEILAFFNFFSTYFFIFKS